jgi:hypothetical protein
MNVAIVHISDLHISGPRDEILSKAEKILAAIRPNILEDHALVLVCTGDIADTGAAQEYQVADGFLKEVAEGLRQIDKASFLGTVMVPGNHDCDFSAEADARTPLLNFVASKLADIDLQGESIQQLLRVQKNFSDFESAFCKRDALPPTNGVSWTFSFAFGGQRILIRCLNTALFSRLKETAGQLYFPIQAVPEVDAAQDVAVTIFHHPYGWLSPDNVRPFRECVESTSDLVLTGHEHDGDSYTRVAHSGEETHYIEGAALQADSKTGFNLILVNLSASTYQVFPYHWTDEMYKPGTSEARVFTRKQSLIQSRFYNNSEFVEVLNDLGTGFCLQ